MPHILVIKLGALGDFIQALGAMKAIRLHHKDAHITLMTTKPFEAFGRRCGYFDEILIDTRPRLKDVRGWMALRKTLCNGRFKRVYDLQNNDRTSLYLRLFPRRKRPEWVGAARGASHRNTAPERIAGHALDGHIQTLALAGIKDIKIDTLDWIDEDLSNFALSPPYALLVPGCAPQHPQKRWPADYFTALANDLAARNIQPVLIGTKDDRDATDRIAESCPQALNLTGQTTLFQIAALARGGVMAIGNDTGPMHLIAATGIQCIALFSGHSNPIRHALKGEKVEILQSANIGDIAIDEVLKKIK